MVRERVEIGRVVGFFALVGALAVLTVASVSALQLEPPGEGAGYVGLWLFVATLVAKALPVGAALLVLGYVGRMVERLMLPVGVAMRANALDLTGGNDRRSQRMMWRVLKALASSASPQAKAVVDATDDS